MNRRRFLYSVAGLSLGMLMPNQLLRASAMELGRGGAPRPPALDDAASDSNTIYLTFDDGYIGIAEKVAALNALGVQGTFFLTGQAVNANLDDVATLLNSGHILANHTYDHQDLTTLDSDGIAWELDTTEQIANQAFGVSTLPLMRPPYGAVDDRVRTVVANLGYQVFMWDWDTRDWAGSSVSYIEQNFGTGIVLMHTQGRNTVAALDDLVPSLAAQGYVFGLL